MLQFFMGLGHMLKWLCRGQQWRWGCCRQWWTWQVEQLSHSTPGHMMSDGNGAYAHCDSPRTAPVMSGCCRRWWAWPVGLHGLLWLSIRLAGTTWPTSRPRTAARYNDKTQFLRSCYMWLPSWHFAGIKGDNLHCRNSQQSRTSSADSKLLPFPKAITDITLGYVTF